MTPTLMLRTLERDGVKLSVRGGKLFASKTATVEHRENIKANKVSLLAVMTHQCPECNQPLRTIKDRDSVSWLQCVRDAAHYGERLGVLEQIPCPGEDCAETIQLADGVGWCSNHQMAVRIEEAR